MNILTYAVRRPRRRIVELDPWIETDVESRAGYGCVDWYVYGEEEVTADTHAARAQPRIATPGLPAATPSELPPRARPH